MRSIVHSILAFTFLLVSGCDDTPKQAEQKKGPPEFPQGKQATRTEKPEDDQIKVILEALAKDDLDKVRESFGETIDPDFTFADGKTVLSAAASLGNERATKLMLEMGADPTKGDKRGMTPLHYAALYGRGDAVIPLLIDAGASVNAREATGLTPLHCAATGDSENTVKVLLDLGADATLKDGFGSTPAKTAELNDKGNLATLIQAHKK